MNGIVAIDLADSQLLVNVIESVAAVTDAVGPGEELLPLRRSGGLVGLKGLDDVVSVVAKTAKGGSLLRHDGLPKTVGNLVLGAGGEHDVIDHDEKPIVPSFPGVNS